MRTKRISVLSLLTLIAAAVCVGSVSAGPITVVTEPAGARVTLKGEMEVHGVAPTVFRQPFSGKYKLVVELEGYERHSQNLEIHLLRADTVQVKLSPRTGPKAAVRSMFIPGWGQHYGQQHGKAFVMHLFAAGSIAAYFITDHNFDIKYGKFEQRRDAFDNAVARGASREELEVLLAVMTQAQDEAFDHEDYRRIAIGAVVSAWAVSILDALFFFPDERGGIEIGPMQVQPSASMDEVGINFAYRF